jgi:hypothetical protein
MRRVRKLRTSGKVVVPPAGQVLFDEPPGDCHIKYGYVIGDSTVSRRQARADLTQRNGLFGKGDGLQNHKATIKTLYNWRLTNLILGHRRVQYLLRTSFPESVVKVC